MGLTATLKNAVDTVFIKVGDLKKVATVTSKNVSGWDVSTGKPTENIVTKDVEVIMIGETSSNMGVITADLIFKTSQLPVDLSSAILIEGSTYRVIPPVDDNGFVVQMKAKKEQ